MTFPLNNKHRGGDFIRSLKATWLNTVATVLNTITGVGIKWVKTANGVGWQTVVDVDGVTLIIDPITSKLRIKNGGVAVAQISASLAGDGLTGGAGSALAVVTDNLTLTISSDKVKIKDGGVGVAQISAALAGDGLTGGAGSALAVVTDNLTLTISSDKVKIKDGGVGVAQISAALAGDGLTGGAGAALAVVTDGITIEINSDALRIKAGGLNSSHITSSYVTGSVNLSSSTETLVFVNGLLTSKS